MALNASQTRWEPQWTRMVQPVTPLATLMVWMLQAWLVPLHHQLPHPHPPHPFAPSAWADGRVTMALHASLMRWEPLWTELVQQAVTPLATLMAWMLQAWLVALLPHPLPLLHPLPLACSARTDGCVTMALNASQTRWEPQWTRMVQPV